VLLTVSSDNNSKSTVNVCTYNPVATEHHTKYNNSLQFKKSICLQIICAYLVLLDLCGAVKTFCIFCSQLQGELFDMRQQQAPKKKMGQERKWGKGCMRHVSTEHKHRQLVHITNTVTKSLLEPINMSCLMIMYGPNVLEVRDRYGSVLIRSDTADAAKASL
jgi:hypothetical protein